MADKDVADEKHVIGQVIDENTIQITFPLKIDLDPFDGLNNDRAIYYSDEPSQILETLPRWLRKPIVAYGRWIIKRKWC